MSQRADIVVIGAGAAGLFAAIWAGRAAREVRSAGASPARPLRIVALDGARTLGAKILVAGGGRCNVTHHAVDESAYAGSSRNAIKQVLRAFPVSRTVEFFAQLGVTLKREETGKLFPTTDDARTVLHALLHAAKDAGAEVVHPWRVGEVRREQDGTFTVVQATPSGGGAPQVIRAQRVILATGGLALPRSGSDGAGYVFARALGHSVTARVEPALVPLVVEDPLLRALSGLSAHAGLEVRSATGRRLVRFENSTLCTHFGLSGPGPLDVSRYLFEAQAEDPGAHLVVSWSPGFTPERYDEHLLARRTTSALRAIADAPSGVPDRLARALIERAGVDLFSPMVNLSRDKRRELADAVTQMRVRVSGSRGFTYAEVTAGGVPLAELHLATMASRATPGLHVIGELCDVDGRIGGFNFQWAWASGFVAGRAAGAAAAQELASRPGAADA